MSAQSAPAATALPFLYGTNEYTEQVTMPNSGTYTLGASQQDFTVNINPNGFLRGVTIQVRSSGGALGTGALNADTPFNLFSNLQLDSVDGSNIIYPMSGFNQFLSTKYFRPWDGDPRVDTTVYSATVNPAFDLRFFAESRGTVGVLPNMDARSQYKLRFSLPALSGFLATVGTATTPTVTISVAIESYSQPAATDIYGRPLAQVPDGVVLQRFVSREQQPTSAGTMTIKSNRTGNMVRNALLVFRNSSGVLTNLTSDPIRFRVDTTAMGTENRAHNVYDQTRLLVGEYGQTLVGQPVTGVYSFPFYHNPGTMQGTSWLDTSQATYLQWEVTGAPAGGTVEIITEDLALVQIPGLPSVIPPYLEGI